MFDWPSGYGVRFTKVRYKHAKDLGFDPQIEHFFAIRGLCAYFAIDSREVPNSFAHRD